MSLARNLIILSSIALALSGCSSFGSRSARAPEPGAPPFKGGGYYKDDGPGANPPANLAAIPDAVPRSEPLHRFANDRYEVLGKTYVPLPAGRAYKERGGASWYGRRYHGKATSSGEVYDMYAMTAAHATLPIPSYVRVTNLTSGRSVVVRINDRGPFHDGRVIDLSYTAAWKLDLLKGVAQVEVELLDPSAPAALPTLAQAAAVEPRAVPATVTVSELPPLSPTPMPAALPRPAAGAASAPAPGAAMALYLQVGAFARIGAADELAQKVQKSLGPQQPGVVRHESAGLIKVQVGPFDNVALADQAAQTLEQSLGIRPYRVSR